MNRILKNKTAPVILYQNKDKTLIYSSYFLITSGTLFGYSAFKAYAFDPDVKAMSVIGLGTLAIPIVCYFGLRSRITRIELHQQNNKKTLKLTNSLPFRNSHNYDLNGFYTNQRSQTGAVTLCLDKKRFLLAGGEFHSSFNSIFYR